MVIITRYAIKLVCVRFFTLQVRASFIEIFHGNGLADAVLSLGPLVLLPPHSFIYPLEGIKKVQFTFRHCPPLCRNLQGVYELFLPHLHFMCVHMCVVNLNNDIMLYYMQWAIRCAPIRRSLTL